MSKEHIIYLVKELREREARAKLLEEQLKEAQANVRYMIESEIPDAMDDEEIDKLVLPDGTKLTVETEYFPQIKAEEAEKAYTWIREAGYGDKLKSVITLEYGMGEDEVCEKVFTLIQSKTLSHAQRTTQMHPSTARAWAREISEKGLSLPPEISIFPLRRAKLVRPRTSTQDGS